MIEISQSKSGLPYAVVNKQRVHSSYNPLNEARRFVETQIEGRPSCIIVLGPGLGYISDLVKEKFPRTKCLSVFYCSEFYRRYTSKNVFCWSPAGSVSLQSFLRSHITELDIPGLRTIEWPSSAKAFPEISERINKEIGQFVREKNGSIVATKFFGKRWIKNSFYNFLHTTVVEQLQKDTKPILIAASGPTLSYSLHAIRKVRSSVRLWALPSSIPALLYHKLIPDLVVVTDPGYYTTLHLRPLFHSHTVPLAMPLSASRGILPWGFPLIPLSQDYFFERSLYDTNAIQPIRVPPNGTVAGTALELSLSFSQNSIFFAGLDFSHKDIQTHVKPHAFDTLFYSSENRLKPYLSHIFFRTTSSTTLPLKTYAGWFSERCTQENRDIYRINPSTVPIRGTKEINSDEAVERIISLSDPFESSAGNRLDGPGKSLPYETPDNTDAEAFIDERKEKVSQLLNEWIKAVRKLQKTLHDAPSSRDTFAEIFRPGVLFDLFFYIDIAGILEFYRSLSLYGLDNSIDKIYRVAREVITFLTECKKDIDGHGR